jgi:uncharacterized protein YdhG (YjbR/CyaY superfamily)
VTFKPASVEEYLASLEGDRRTRFEVLRAAVVAAAGEALEVISYDMPAYKIGSRFVCSIGAFKAHDSLFPASQVVIDRLGAEVDPYVKGRGTFQFPLERELPVALIGRIVAIRLEEVRDAEAAAATTAKRRDPAP